MYIYTQKIHVVRRANNNHKNNNNKKNNNNNNNEVRNTKTTRKAKNSVICKILMHGNAESKRN